MASIFDSKFVQEQASPQGYRFSALMVWNSWKIFLACRSKIFWTLLMAFTFLFFYFTCFSSYLGNLTFQGRYEAKNKILLDLHTQMKEKENYVQDLENNIARIENKELPIEVEKIQTQWRRDDYSLQQFFLGSSYSFRNVFPEQAKDPILTLYETQILTETSKILVNGQIDLSKITASEQEKEFLMMQEKLIKSMNSTPFLKNTGFISTRVEKTEHSTLGYFTFQTELQNIEDHDDADDRTQFLEYARQKLINTKIKRQ